MPSSKYWRYKTIKKEENKKLLGTLLLWFVCVAILISALWLLFFSPFFRISNIKLPENSAVSSGDVYKFIINSAPLDLGENLFILSKNKLKTDLAAAFPTITNINITKEPLHNLVINFEKRIQIGIWCDNNCYYFDKEGIIFKEAPQTEGALILKIKDFQKNNVKLGDNILNTQELNFIIKFNDEVSSRKQFKITEFDINPSTDVNLQAMTDHGFLIYLDPNQDTALETSNLFTVLTEAVKNNVSNLQYVDLRIPSRIYYKLK